MARDFRQRWLLFALLGLVLYAAFADGATDVPQETWLQVALLVLAAVAAAGILFGRRLGLRLSRVGWAGLALLTAFALWNGLTIAWSVAPDRSWLEVNRALAYVLAAGLGAVLGSTVRDAPRHFAAGLAIVAAPVALYALGGKTLPGLHIGGLFSLDHAGAVTRLRAPLEYWNALALFCVLAVAPALRLAADPERRPAPRLLALSLLYTLLVVVGLTYSRGGVLALVVGVTAYVVLSRTERLRTVTLFAAAALAAAFPLAVALTRHDLTTNALPLTQREDDAFAVLVTFAVLLALLLGFAALLLRLEPRFSVERGRRAGRVLAFAAAGLLVLSVGNAAATGAIGRAADRFTDIRRSDKLTDPNRLLSTNSGNRWVWWQEAAGAWSDKPVAGWGAGSFPITHRLYRKELLSVRQPHSVPLQWLAETGLVGAVLALAALTALLAAALARIREVGPYAAALWAGGAAWVAHSLYDWDWDIPGVTVPMLIGLGVVAARPAVRAAPWRTPGARGAALAGMVVALVLAGVSVALPALAEERTAAALERAGGEASDAALADAAATAEFAASLNPLAVEPLFAAASIAERRGRLDEARRLLLRAAERQPDNADPWFRLLRIDLARLDRASLRRAAQRVVELDPLNPVAFAAARNAEAAAAPPEESATATGAPLPTTVPAP